MAEVRIKFSYTFPIIRGSAFPDFIIIVDGGHSLNEVPIARTHIPIAGLLLLD
jgi:hypothetical protein